ncbi:MAG TPA: CHAT domain-containing protein, partial [Myxococcaceae bacterium]|nr:CHAT domain-containing protein [Myxococcaceae bacterium]
MRGRRVRFLIGLSWWGLAALAGVCHAATSLPLRPLAECQAIVRREPRSLDGYACLLAHRGTQGPEVRRFLEERLRRDPEDPRPRLYLGIVRSLAHEVVDEREWVKAEEGFAREHEVTGEFYALVSHVSSRCIGEVSCDEKLRSLMWRAGELARTSGKPALMQQTEIWRMKVALATDDLAAADEAEARLLALGEPASAWLRTEGLQARAHRAWMMRDYSRQRGLYRELLEVIPPGDPRRAAALGGMATGTVHLALQGLESREVAERALREAIAEEERVKLRLLYVDIGYLPQKVQLAVLLGPVPESFALLRSVLEEYRSTGRWVSPIYVEMALAELLSTASPPRMDEALAMAEDTIRDAGPVGDYEKLRALVLRSRVRFRAGQFWLARADGLAALDHADRLRGRQGSISVGARYAESLSFAYRSVAGALMAYRPADDASALDDAFQIMERLRARGLMETLLAAERAGDPESPAPPGPGLRQIQAALGRSEALLSFQVWHPEPTLDAPYREGSSWLTVVTRGTVSALRIPDGDALEAQIRAWTGLLERRDGSDRAPGARLFEELLGRALAVLPPEIDRLVIVPDGPLHRLPLDALSAGPGKPYLAERFALSVEPSAALWLRVRAAPRQGPGRLVVLADPAGPSSVQAVRRDAAGLLGTLVHARREAEVALSAFPVGSELRSGPAASEAFLKSANLEGVSLLHLATHAVVDVGDPERSAVVLAPGGPIEDGRLEAREIARLGLAGRTVVLAACETSAGPVYRGEGVMSLARAFFGAGATAVVGTLDRTRDDEAGAFFTAMYRTLGRGATLGEAVA